MCVLRIWAILGPPREPKRNYGISRKHCKNKGFRARPRSGNHKKKHKISMQNSIPSQRNTGCALSRIHENSMVATPLLAILDNSAKYLRILTSTMMKKWKFYGISRKCWLAALKLTCGPPPKSQKTTWRTPKVLRFEQTHIKINDSEAFYENISMVSMEFSWFFANQ